MKGPGESETQKKEGRKEPPNWGGEGQKINIRESSAILGGGGEDESKTKVRSGRPTKGTKGAIDKNADKGPMNIF